MAFTEPEKVQIRRYMRWPPGNTEPRYDSQIQRIQSAAEGGVMPDNSTELAARELLAELAAKQTELAGISCSAEAGNVDEINVDGPRGGMWLRSEGRRLVGDLAAYLEATPLGDAFSARGFRGYV
jgi:hypothetical protein